MLDLIFPEERCYVMSTGSEIKTDRTVVGVDTAKRVFQLHWVDIEAGEIVDLRLTRPNFLKHFANRTPCLVRWKRAARNTGRVRSGISATYPGCYRPRRGPSCPSTRTVRTTHRAMWSAAQMPDVRTVAVKSEERQTILALHRMRQRLVIFHHINIQL